MNLQNASGEQGRMFEDQCRFLLGDLGWITSGPMILDEAGVEVDIVAERDGDVVFYECKGSWRGERPGLRRTDTVKKAVANGFLIRAAGITTPSLLITTEEAASMLALTPQAVRMKLRRGEVPGRRIGRRSWRLVRQDVLTFVATGTWPAPINLDEAV